MSCIIISFRAAFAFKLWLSQHLKAELLSWLKENSVILLKGLIPVRKESCFLLGLLANILQTISKPKLQALIQ